MKLTAYKTGNLMMILVIQASPRAVWSGTRKLAALVLEGAAEIGAETEILDLAQFRITPCSACESCMLNGVCVNDDDVPNILARMREADGIVFASPVYIDNVTGQMKVFFDRLADAIHYQVLTGKYGSAVVTTYDSGGGEVAEYLNHVLNYLGVISVGSISVATQGDAEAIDRAKPVARALGKKLADAIQNSYSDPIQEKILADNRGYFKTIVEENRDFRTTEYEEWERKGWLK
jgi:multimeric flavodoxin WrbA